MKNKFFENDFNCLVSDFKGHDGIKSLKNDITYIS